MRSDRSTVRTCDRRASEASCAAALLLGRRQSRPQDAHRLLAVLQLRLLVLTADDDPGREMRDANRGVRGVDALPTGSTAAVHVDTEVVGVNLNLDIFSFGKHENPGGAGVDSPLAFGDRDPLNAMYSTLVLQLAQTPSPGAGFPRDFTATETSL